LTLVPAWTSSRVVGRVALGAAAGVSLAYILLPMFFVIWLAFFAQEIPSFPPEGYSLKWFRAVPGNDRFVSGFLLSLQVAVVATSIGLAIGVPAAVCLVRGRFIGREAVNNLLLLLDLWCCRTSTRASPRSSPTSSTSPTIWVGTKSSQPLHLSGPYPAIAGQARQNGRQVREGPMVW